MIYIDLFSVCGGLALGLHNAGWKGLFAVEKSKDAFATLEHNLINKNTNFIWPNWLDKKNHDINNIIEKYKEQFESPDFYFEKELYDIYAEALNKLPANFKETFEMSRRQMLTHKEIAAILDVSPQTVNYRLSKALEILRVELKDYLPLMLLLFASKNI